MWFYTICTAYVFVHTHTTLNLIQYIPHTAVCTPGCQNGGTCTSPGVCVCAAGWDDDRCSTGMNVCVCIYILLYALQFSRGVYFANILSFSDFRILIFAYGHVLPLHKSPI